MLNELTEQVALKTKKQSIKCVVWDLDNTLWDNVLLEDEHVTLRPDVLEVIKTLDSRGILNSIASKNDYATAMGKLEQLGIQQYFLYPQIHWNPKSSSVKAIAKSINIGLDTLAFVDDQPFEREEVAFSLPEVLCIDSADINTMLAMPEMNPRFITDDSRMRRLMYQSDIERGKAEKEFSGSNEEFLATLEMEFTIAPAREADLQRAEELTVRTHQLNTTGRTYSYEELNQIRQSPQHRLLVADLKDKYGAYGKIGLALVDCNEHTWTIKLLLMSCRVMSRGVGTILINYIMQQAKQANVRLQADFLETDRNRMMYITYKFGGFKEVDRAGDLVVFENDLTHIQPFPEYVTVHIEE
ncbi:MAG TPA: HAD-IIIC family phosphatase [Ktedonobacteraceae bacterium]|nr:HAD-IIIC family phosphatase [Ktedonobacteraceae bacterium]